MSTESPSFDELIVGHMNDLNRLVTQDVEWIEGQSNLEPYSVHVSNLESNLYRHANKILTLRKRVIRQLSTKCGPAGKEIYGRSETRFAKIGAVAFWGLVLGGLLGAAVEFAAGAIGLGEFGRLPQLATIAAASAWLGDRYLSTQHAEAA